MSEQTDFKDRVTLPEGDLLLCFLESRLLFVEPGQDLDVPELGQHGGNIVVEFNLTPLYTL